jgi:hypothetical protein
LDCTIHLVLLSLTIRPNSLALPVNSSNVSLAALKVGQIFSRTKLRVFR